MRTTPLIRHLLLAAFSGLFLAACKKEYNTIAHPPIVNAGASQTIQLPVDSVTLSGSAKAVDSKIVAYLWSEISGPNIPAIMSEGSPTTEVRNLITGTYLFQLMAVDSIGATGVDSLMITVKPPSMVTLIQANNPNEINLAGNSTTDLSDPNAPELDAAAWTNNSAPDIIRGMFKFDFSTLPANVPIKSAKLTLFSNPTPTNGNLVNANYGTSNAFYIQRIKSSWNPLTVKFPTQPGVDTSGEVLIPQTNLSTLDLVNIDVTAMVNNMISSGNYGFMLRLQNEVAYNSRIFCSSSYSDPTKYPQLIINY
jgi:hypothetical protein